MPRPGFSRQAAGNTDGVRGGSGARRTVRCCRDRAGESRRTAAHHRARDARCSGTGFWIARRCRGGAAETLPLRPAAGLAVLDLPNAHELAAGGRFKPMGSFWELVDRMNHDLARRLASRGKDFPVSEYLDSARVPAERRGLLRDFVQGFYAAHPDRLSAQSLAVEIADGEERDEVQGKQFRIANGGDALMKWLRDGLDPERTELRLSTIAESVQWKRGFATAACRRGDRGPLTALTARSALTHP